MELQEKNKQIDQRLELRQKQFQLLLHALSDLERDLTEVDDEALLAEKAEEGQKEAEQETGDLPLEEAVEDSVAGPVEGEEDSSMAVEDEAQSRRPSRSASERRGRSRSRTPARFEEEGERMDEEEREEGEA